MIRVVVVDDEYLIRLGLRVLLENEPDIEFLGEAEDGRSAIELVRRVRPDVVLMDVRMPVMSGIEALREISADASLTRVRILVMTTFELDEYVFDALQSGASGFLIKDAEPAQLLHAVRVVAKGESLLSPSVTRRVIKEFAKRPIRGAMPHTAIQELTTREREVVALVAIGLSNREIAVRLFLSPETVRTHVSRAIGKLGVRDRAQLVVFAYQSGLVPQEAPAK